MTNNPIKKPYLLRESKDFNIEIIILIEDIVRSEFSQEQYSEYCKNYNNRYFGGNANRLSSIIYYEIRKGKEGNFYIFQTSTSALSGERSDSTYLLCYEIDGNYWGFQEWDTERDSYEKRIENREKYNYIYESTESLIKLSGYKLEVEFIYNKSKIE
jgi:hypothetical protein